MQRSGEAVTVCQDGKRHKWHINSLHGVEMWRLFVLHANGLQHCRHVRLVLTRSVRSLTPLTVNSVPAKMHTHVHAHTHTQGQNERNFINMIQYYWHVMVLISLPFGKGGSYHLSHPTSIMTTVTLPAQNRDLLHMDDKAQGLVR